MNAPQDFRTMTAESVGKDLLSALVTEIKLLPDTWPKIPQKKQDDIIDRLRERVDNQVKMAVHLLAAEGRTVVAGDLDQITIKDGVKAVVKFGSQAENLHELYDMAGKAVLLVVASASAHTGGMDEIHGEADQRAMDLGHEYKPNSDGDGMDNRNVVDAEFTETKKLPATSWPFPKRATYIKTAKHGDVPNQHGVYTCEPDEAVIFEAKNVSIKVELLELETGIWLYSTSVKINDRGWSGPLSITECDPVSREDALFAAQKELIAICAKGESSGIKGKALKDFTAWVDGLAEADRKAA